MGPSSVAGSHLLSDNMFGKYSSSSGKIYRSLKGLRKEYPAGSQAGNDSWAASTSYFNVLTYLFVSAWPAAIFIDFSASCRCK